MAQNSEYYFGGPLNDAQFRAELRADLRSLNEHKALNRALAEVTHIVEPNPTKLQRFGGRVIETVQQVRYDIHVVFGKSDDSTEYTGPVGVEMNLAGDDSTEILLD